MSSNNRETDVDSKTNDKVFVSANTCVKRPREKELTTDNYPAAKRACTHSDSENIT